MSKELPIRHKILAGRNLKWDTITGGFRDGLAPGPDGSTILTTGDRSCLAIYSSRVSGGDALLVAIGRRAPNADTLAAEGAKFSFLILGGAHYVVPGVMPFSL